MVDPIIVIEDDRDSQKELTGIFTEAGFPCIARSSLEGAIETLRQQSVSIVIISFAPSTRADPAQVVKTLRDAESELGERRLQLVGVVSHRSIAEGFIDGGGDVVFIRPLNAQKLIDQVRKAHHRTAAGTESTGRGVGIPFKPKSVVSTTPPVPGVLTVRNRHGQALLIEWSTQIRSHLQELLATGNESHPGLLAEAATVDFLVTEDETLAGAVYDREVAALDDFPRFTFPPPPGSCHAGATSSDSIESTDDSMAFDRPMDPAELDEAREAFQADPDDAVAKDWYAFLCYRFGHHDEAMQYFAELIDGGSSAPEHFYYLGCSLHAMGNQELAHEMWNRVLQTDPDSRMARKCQRRLQEATATAQD